MSEVLEKGMRVRVTEGDSVGVEGELFWIGRSKYGPEIRVGLKSEADDAQVWVMATEIRAIDEQGAELDPQPELPSTGPKVPQREYTFRPINVPLDMGRIITTIRLEKGYPATKASGTVIRMDFLDNTEKLIGCSIPDAVITYVTSGMGVHRSKDITAVATLTRKLIDARDPHAITPLEEAPQIAFDLDGDTFLAFERGASLDTLDVTRLEAKNGWKTTPEINLAGLLTDRVGKVSPSTEPFQLMVDYLTTEKPVEEVESNERWVTHKTFGRGLVTDITPSSKGDKLTIEFEGGETRKLLARFIEFE